jgi:hypothetical protein
MIDRQWSAEVSAFPRGSRARLKAPYPKGSGFALCRPQAAPALRQRRAARAQELDGKRQSLTPLGKRTFQDCSIEPPGRLRSGASGREATR